MGHPAVDNKTPFALEPLFVTDEEGRPLLVALVQATFDLHPVRGVERAEQQPPPSLAGELWGADAATSSYKIEPTFAFFKPATDVVLIGHAQAPRHSVPELQVVFRVGPVGKAVRVLGDRAWVRNAGGLVPSRPRPFDRVPLNYEHAFGGWDRTHPDPAKHALEPRNPVGIGFRAPNAAVEEGLRLPNIEDPNDPLQHYGQVVAPAGLGFVSPDWQPRATLAGTYDEAWTKERMPLLPKDFDRRFFNAASKGLVAPGYLRGDEPVLVENASPFGRLSFRLPGLSAPRCRVELVRQEDAQVELRLDTVIVDTDADRVMTLFRGYVALRDGPHDVRTIAIEEDLGAVRRQVPSGWSREGARP
ncbi:DUF2169 family type VI secretion system accessory protein [Sorangium atrum]|uniref:DUF2169 domain-containing protein n=1 Tax=Sorangium atrum TaxID=2995308 RepID=A0ABT5BSM6_9BACT|nr:DUF2169 domain-containing protein [Sorangium aterium]MDC0677160.1 DUF2169 domain-containing protein [Sorangium aterium]